jgi:hypothetical protein
MPEIKNSFTGGKMNKDLDERLIPNGEYRDAMNIEVSTSEGSDVGTVQNILGNSFGCSSHLDGLGHTVGSISDERNDTLYWFTTDTPTGQSTPSPSALLSTFDQNVELSISDILDDTGDPNSTPEPIIPHPLSLYDANGDYIPGKIYPIKDAIRRKKEDVCENVFIDIYGAIVIYPPAVDVNNLISSGVNELVDLPGEILQMVSEGWQVTGVNSAGETCNTRTVTGQDYLANIPFEIGYDPGYQTYGGSTAGTVQLGLSAMAGFYGSNVGVSINLPTNPNIIYLPENAFSGGTGGFTGSPPPGSDIVVMDAIGTTITQANTMVVNSSVVDIQYYSGIGQFLVEIELDKPFTTTFYNDWNTYVAPGLQIPVGVPNANTNLIDNSNSTCISQTGMLDGGYSATVSYTEIVSLGVINGDLNFDSAYYAVINSWTVGDEIRSNHRFPELTTGSGIGGCIETITTPNALQPLKKTVTIDDCSGTQILPNAYSPHMPITTGYLTVESDDTGVIYLDDDLDLHLDPGSGKPTALIFSSTNKKTLRLSVDNPITGVNIIDDMLFWTDGSSEPKKINIPRSIRGTDPSGNRHTRVVNDSLGYGIDLPSVGYDVLAKEKHITVIKKSPLTPLLVNLDSGRNPEWDQSARMTISGENNTGSSSFTSTSETIGMFDFSTVSPGMNIFLEITEDSNGSDTFNLVDLSGNPWAVGTKIVLREYEDDGDITIPVKDWRLKGHIGAWEDHNPNASTGNPAYLKIVVDFIKGDVPTAGGSNDTLDYVIDLYSEHPSGVFEFKFPRFSYRYKYEDGEYSTFAPFTEVAFLPGRFEFHPKEGYNLAMTNSIQSVHLEDFITPDMPVDVTSIDILYKDDQSANIYVVDTIKPMSDMAHNPWNLNKYTVTSDIIHTILPSNQLLRSWDNVPKKALAQEVVGNRIVYGNYTQGHDLIDSYGQDVYPNFVHNLVHNPDNTKSIKSLREYQLGVVFVDEFGRETPVITNKTGSFKVEKSDGIYKNKLNVAFAKYAEGPQNMKYFKFYIKETSGEYYNMAMDRWYDAEDGGIWLSFSSSDRNKVDIDTFLILKKGVESDVLVTDPARFKILAIENEAPDFIKTSQYNIGELKQGGTDELFGTDTEHAPLEGDSTFALDLYRFKDSSLNKLDELISEHDIYVDFYIEDDVYATTRKYRVTNASKEDVEDGTSLQYGLAKFNFTIDGYFGDDVDRIFDGPATAPTNVKSNARVRFYKAVVENAPRFDGKFFVKIHAENSSFQTNIATTENIDPKEWRSLFNKKVYFMADDHADRHGGANAKYGAKVFGDDDFFQDLMDSEYEMDSWINTFQMSGGHDHPHAFYFQPNGGGWPKQFAINKGSHKALTGWKEIPDNYQAFRAYFKNTVTNLWAEGSTDDQQRGLLHKSDLSSVAILDPTNDYYPAITMFGIQDDALMRDADSDFAFEDVLFIDNGPRKNKNGSFSEKWRRDGFGSGGTGTGIINYGNIEGIMDLGFGPVAPEFGLPYEDAGYMGGSNAHLNWRYWNDNFWDFQASERSRYNNTTDAKIIGEIDAGMKFRWIEDPNQTVYTVFKSYANSGQNRYEDSGRGQGTGPDNVSYDYMLYNYVNKSEDGTKNYGWDSQYRAGEYKQSRIDKPFYYAGENFTDNTRFHFQPAMNTWDPTMQGVEGPIAGGRNIYRSKSNTGVYSDIESMSGSWGLTAFKISKTQFESSWDDEKEEYAEIAVGMLLTHVKQNSWSTNNLTNSDGSLINGGYLINKIHQDGGNYVIGVTGYTDYRAGTTTGATLDDFDSIDSGALSLTFRQPAMNGLSVNSVKNINKNYDLGGLYGAIGIGAVGYTLEIIEEIKQNTTIPTNPAVWETEPKESTELDIYYEISGKNPIYLNEDTINLAIPIGSSVSFPAGAAWDLSTLVTVIQYYPPVGNRIILSEFICANTSGNTCTDSSGSIIAPLQIGDDIKITKPNGSQTTVKVSGIRAAEEDYTGMGYDISKVITIDPNLYHSNHTLSWHNCFSFGNGVESNRIRDNFNLPFISNGVRASITLEDFPREEDRKYGLIYSGLYNSNTGTNNLNQFIMAEKITKDINPTYGSIQKLHTRDSDLLTLCQDKVLKILANKDAVYNADGNPNLTATQNVLGQTIPFVGEYGISNNPESFASEAYRAYFTDKVRGVVLRLSKDGLTPISNFGMRDWFRDNLKLSNTLLGSYDDRKDEYNLTIKGSANKTVSFNEAVKGWVSFKSFVPENAISCANEYYTFKNNRIWKHHNEDAPRNTFYTIHTPSSVNVILNEQPSIVKTFKTLNYEGSQSRIDELKSYQIYLPGTIDPDTGIGVVNPDYLEPLSDGEYFNLNSQDGWYVQSIKTDLETGSLNEFIEKEGKWFNYIRGVADIPTTMGTFLGTFDSSDISFQGLGRLAEHPQVYSFQGCTDPNANNYNPNASVDDNSCDYCIYGCTDPGGINYNASATCDDGSCVIIGCTDPTAFNYNPNANVDDSSCIPVIYGCTTASNFNYDANANTDDGSCIPVVYGCIDPTAVNYNANANTDDSSCTYPVYGCSNNGACNYNPNVTDPAWDDGSCLYCGDPGANNFDGWVNGDSNLPPVATYAGGQTACNVGCAYCAYVDNFQSTGNISTSEIELSWDETWGPNNPNFDITAPVDHYIIQYKKTSDTTWTTHNVNYIVTGTPTTVTYGVSGLDAGTEYVFEVYAVCQSGTSTANPTWYTSSDPAINTVVASTNQPLVMGCLDNTGIGNPIGSWMACNYCPTCNADASGHIGGNDYSNCNYDICHGCMNPTYQEFCDTCWNPADQQVVTDGSGQPWYGELGIPGDPGSDCMNPIIYGCTDPAAFNYDSTATQDDGSCVAVVLGCTDNTTLNYDGTTAATNYNNNANTDDGSCLYDTSGLDVTWILATNPLTSAGGWWTQPGINAIVDANLVPQGLTLTWSVFADGTGPFTQWSTGGNATNVAVSIENQLQQDGIADLVHVADSQAVQSSVWTITGTASWPGTNIPDQTFTDDYTVIVGCTDPLACNYDPAAVFEIGGSCIMPAGCDDPAALNFTAITPPNCADNANDCNYCATDPDVVNATVHTITPNQSYYFIWSDIGLLYTGTNGTNQGTVQVGTTQAGVYATKAAYKIEYRYKLVGAAWTSWVVMGPSYNVAGCLAYSTFADEAPIGVIIDAGNATIPMYNLPNASTGAYNSGTQWQLRVRNRCTDCSSGNILKTPKLTL